MPADDGPASWQRIDVHVDPARDDGLAPGTPAARSTSSCRPQPIEPVALPGGRRCSNIDLGEQDLSFDVDQIGVPVLVKISYFPNWQVDGAEGPWRIGPNMMVVVPTSTHVRLHYERVDARLRRLPADVHRHRRCWSCSGVRGDVAPPRRRQPVRRATARRRDRRRRRSPVRRPATLDVRCDRDRWRAAPALDDRTRCRDPTVGEPRPADAAPTRRTALGAGDARLQRSPDGADDGARPSSDAPRRRSTATRRGPMTRSGDDHSAVDDDHRPVALPMADVIAPIPQVLDDDRQGLRRPRHRARPDQRRGRPRARRRLRPLRRRAARRSSAATCAPSGPELVEAFAAGVMEQGVDVVDLGLASTDLVYYAAGTLDAPGAVFTASHNPAQYNGVKFCLVRRPPGRARTPG